MKYFFLLVFLFSISFLGFSQEKSLNTQTDEQLVSPNVVQTPIAFELTKPLRDNPIVTEVGLHEFEFMMNAHRDREIDPNIKPPNFNELPEDKNEQTKAGSKYSSKGLIKNFEGQSSGSYPPDCNGTVGSDYYFQVVNATYAIYDKATEAIVAGPSNLNTIFNPSLPGANCNSGDPIVLWDEHANKWFYAEFSLCTSNDYMLIAVSQTDDPTGAWYSWSYDVDDMPDYMKFGIWEDGYYMGTNTSGRNDVYVFDRTAMIAGDANPTMIGFDNPNRPNTFDGFHCILPLDNDGAWAPSGDPGQFITIADGDQGNPADELWIYELDADWVTPVNSTFGRTQTIGVNAFAGNFTGDWNNIPQTGTSRKLDAISTVLMYRAQYRNFAGDQRLVIAHAIAEASDEAALRWYELENAGAGWSIRQQSTYNPDNISRWNMSIAMNGAKEIGIGYSVSNASMSPGIRYVGQSAAANTAANNTLDMAETNIWIGANSQTAANRWGDYSNISIDPSDDHTFWFTSEYMGAASHGTRVASFDFSVLPIPPVTNFNADDTTPGIGQTVTFTDTSTNAPTTWSWVFSPSTITYVGGTSSTSQNPQVTFDAVGTYTVSLTATNAFGTDDEIKVDYINANVCSECYSYGNTDYATSTTRVVFNTINNPSAKPVDSNGNAYSDYTNISTDVLLGQSYDLSTYVNTDGNFWVYTKVWIDWNHDCDFEDAGEEYDLGRVRNKTDGITNNSPFSVTIPVDAYVGNTTMRVSSKFDSYATSCETGFDGEVEDYTINILYNCTGVTKTWDGAAWSPLGDPDSTNPVIIAGNYNTSTADITCCNMTINNGVTLTVAKDEFIKLKRDFINNGIIIVEHEGSLVQEDEDTNVSGSGSYQIHKTTTEYHEYDYTFWSSPVVNETINMFQVNEYDYIYSLTTENFIDEHGGSYPQTTGTSDSFDDEAPWDWQGVSTGDIMILGKGYIAMGEGADFPIDMGNLDPLTTQSVVFDAGKVNNGIISVSVSLDGYNIANGTGSGSLYDFNTNANLIGNPYPSAIDLELLKNDVDNTELTGTFYLWSHDSQIGSGSNNGPEAYNFTNDDYATYVSGTGGTAAHGPGSTGASIIPNQYLASGQGFLANVNATGSISFKNSMRVTGNNNQFFDPNTGTDRLWLNLTTEEGIFRQILVAFVTEASDTYDEFDGNRLENGSSTDFYSMASDKTNRLAVQGLGSFEDTKTIKLGLEIIEGGVYTIAIDHLEGIFENGQIIYLEDKYVGSLHDLTTSGYEFSSFVGDRIDNRFVLHFVTESLTIANEVMNTVSIYPNPSDKIFNLTILTDEVINIEVFDITGKQLINKVGTNARQIDLSGYVAGFYFARISQNGHHIIKKLILK